MPEWITQYPEIVEGRITKTIGVSPAGQSARTLITEACKWAEDELLTHTFPHGTKIKFKLLGYSIDRRPNPDDTEEVTATFSYRAQLF